MLSSRKSDMQIWVNYDLQHALTIYNHSVAVRSRLYVMLSVLYNVINRSIQHTFVSDLSDLGDYRAGLAMFC